MPMLEFVGVACPVVDGGGAVGVAGGGEVGDAANGWPHLLQNICPGWTLTPQWLQNMASPRAGKSTVEGRQSKVERDVRLSTLDALYKYTSTTLQKFGPVRMSVPAW